MYPALFFALFAVAPRRSALAAGCIVLAGNILAGTLLMSIPADTDVTVKAAVVQGNIPSDEKWDKERAQDIFNTYVSLAEEAAQNGASFILLPESAVPVQFTEGGALHTAYAEITEEYGCTIVTGAIFKDDKSEYNSVIAIFPDGSLSERYVKRHIVPFGEFMPYEDVLKRAFPFLEELNIGYSDCVQGTESTVIDVCGIPAGPLVCYDSIFASLSADSVKNGAKLLAVVTNDSWYKDSAALSQHMAHSVLRAVENGTYTVPCGQYGNIMHNRAERKHNHHDRAGNAFRRICGRRRGNTQDALFIHRRRIALCLHCICRVYGMCVYIYQNKEKDSGKT